MPAVPAEAVHALRRVVGACSPLSSQGRLISLGVASLDHALGGGLASEGIHEISPAHPLHRGAATGFVLTLLALALAADGETGTGSGKNQAGDGHAAGAAQRRLRVAEDAHRPLPPPRLRTDKGGTSRMFGEKSPLHSLTGAAPISGVNE